MYPERLKSRWARQAQAVGRRHRLDAVGQRAPERGGVLVGLARSAPRRASPARPRARARWRTGSRRSPRPRPRRPSDPLERRPPAAPSCRTRPSGIPPDDRLPHHEHVRLEPPAARSGRPARRTSVWVSSRIRSDVRIRGRRRRPSWKPSAGSITPVLVTRPRSARTRRRHAQVRAPGLEVVVRDEPHVTNDVRREAAPSGIDGRNRRAGRAARPRGRGTCRRTSARSRVP